MQEMSQKAGQAVLSRAWLCYVCSLLRDQKHHQEKPVGPTELNLLHMLQLRGQHVTVGPPNEDVRKGYLPGLGAGVIFKSGLVKWGAVGIGQRFFPLSAMDWRTQKCGGHEMGLEELVLVLISKLFSGYRVLFSGSRHFLEYPGELFFPVLNFF